ncbi:protein of unknown function DUF74 [Staphylothermus marinus F1]|uniref:UPF0145 protein Smar_0755 n=1 Tax=Staphylothermus marinus (strain ATCC 43588 / DSM 3639 / JCM 9404 / F1) TaxID=399550 RepID=A3DMJ6_STAMF|nr:YbjQ family protein [Staphylothermus marinus]ABN69856.1 protein of unknown function DUF74 [Staphylothermus marinus F1]
MKDILLTTTENIPGYRIVKVLGIVSANTVRARHIGKDFVASLRNIVGGEIKEYAELLQHSRRYVLDKLKEEARKLGANAVVGLRFSTASIMQRAAEILAYGTAVVVEES